MSNINIFEKIILDNYRSANDIEKIILLLREQGASQIETVKALTTSLKISLRDADGYVLNSATWKDSYESTKRVRDEFWKGADGNS